MTITNDVIREVFLAKGFKIPEGLDDLRPYVYEAAKELLRRYGHMEAAETPDESVSDTRYLELQLEEAVNQRDLAVRKLACLSDARALNNLYGAGLCQEREI